MQWPLLKPKIYFVYAERYQHAGSTVLRGEQLSKIAARHVPSHRVLYAPTTQHLKNSTLFLTKGAVLELQQKDLETLKLNHNRLFFDPVDSNLPKYVAEYADTIVAASKTAFTTYKKQYPKTRIVLVDHHVDTRLQHAFRGKNLPVLSAGYFGELVNTVMTPNIESLVNFVGVNTSRRDVDWIKKVADYNLHYAVRNTKNIRGYKPFLKGFTAAYCGANVLIQKSDLEATRWLGDDYPFLLDEPADETAILQKLGDIEKSFCTAEWKRALKTMQFVKNEVSNDKIGQQLQDLFAR